MFKYEKPNQRLTKVKAYDLILSLTRGETLDNRQLSSLLVYFAPAAPKKPKTLFDWVKKATAKKDVRNYLNYVYSDGERIYASNGHIVLMVNTGQYDSGYYCPKTSIKDSTVDYQYPDISRCVVPRNNMVDAPIKRSYEYNTAMKQERVVIGEHVYDTAYVQMMDNYPGTNDTYLQQQTGKGTLVLKSYTGEVLGVVMALRK